MAERESEVLASSFSSDLEGFVAGGFPKARPRGWVHSHTRFSTGEFVPHRSAIEESERISDYRAIYGIVSSPRLITVHMVGHRKDIYRQ